jgi:hypothetical protein
MAALSPARRLAAALDPVVRMRQAGIEADPWQKVALRTTAERTIILGSRQGGKSTVVATDALHVAEQDPPGDVIIGAVKQDQSAEMLRKSKTIYGITGSIYEDELDGNSVLHVAMPNGSRILAVPGKAATVRSFTAKKLIIDEAAYVPDEFYMSVFPMLAVSRGRIVLLSTAHAKAGAFYNIWEKAPAWDFSQPAEAQQNAWLKIKVPWWDCPRITPEFIQAERERFGEQYVLREYCCEFADPVAATFRGVDIDAMARDDLEVWAL